MVFCEEHCRAAEQRGWPTGLQAFLSYRGVTKGKYNSLSVTLVVFNPLMAELIFLGRSFYLRMNLTYSISAPVGFLDSKMHTATGPVYSR